MIAKLLYLVCVVVSTKALSLAPLGCLYEGKLIDPGVSFNPHPCAWCFCPNEGGEAMCAWMDCALEMCVDRVQSPNQCCPECPNGPNCYAGKKIIPAGSDVVVGDLLCRCKDFEEQAFCRPNGCLYEGTVYPAGESFQQGDCIHCFCPPEGGQAFCAITDCFFNACVDFEYIPGKCCPECPNGPNCYLDGRIIPAGVDVIDDNRVCRCEEFSFGFQDAQAICFIVETPPPGCMYDGQLYEPGKPFHPSPCMMCECPEEGGEPMCMYIDCLLPPCVDAKVPAGKCCAECPTGPNCYLGTEIIPAGIEHNDNGRICVCPDAPEGMGTSASEAQAVCTSTGPLTTPPSTPP